jgi:two-component system chemotaxis response regulator CheY
LIDDSAFVRRDLRQTLAPLGYVIIEAGDGTEGLKALSANPDVKLVFLDVNMPNLDGLSLAERVSAEVEAKRLPPIQIVMLTTENTKEKVLRAKKAGVLGWIIKPANKEHVLQLAAKLAPLAAA